MPEQESKKRHMKLKEKGCLISAVKKGSPAAAAGLKAGWRLYRIDNYSPADIIDFKVMESDDRMSLLVQDERGMFRRKTINKETEEGLGLSFDPPTLGTLQKCGNRCIFCFIDQNPQNMRSSLYLKDDDYRLSFLYGNFITLNRLTEPEIERIIRLQLSPLYVSVHTTNPGLRIKMFGTGRAERGLENLKRLVDKGISIHAQIVLCPDINTGNELIKTVEDLHAMGEGILSVALVPVGLTGYRGELEALRAFTADEAMNLVNSIEKMQNKYMAERKSRFVFIADELYNLADFDYPPCEAYEEFPQLENGVGLARIFLDELEQLSDPGAVKLSTDLKITIAAGFAAKRVLESLFNYLSGVGGLNANLEIIENNYFGGHVSVSGLLTGSDLIEALKEKELGDALFVSKSMLKEDGLLFLDDFSISDLELKLGIKIYPVSGPVELVQKIIEIDKSR